MHIRHLDAHVTNHGDVARLKVDIACRCETEKIKEDAIHEALEYIRAALHAELITSTEHNALKARLRNKEKPQLHLLQPLEEMIEIPKEEAA